MARRDCPYCDARQMITIANTNIETQCEFCIDGVVPRPPNFDPGKEPRTEPRTMLARLQAGVSRLMTKG